ncbi:MAG TPA: flagellar hook-length control protein FliK [Rhodocyclaceae bacterium]
MPQLNVAPSPSPVVAPPAAANAASPDAAASGSPADGAPAQPFAAVLQHQVNQQSSSKQSADKSGAPATAKTGAGDKAPELAADAPPPDALAAIAQMLAGITAPSTAAQAPQQGADPGAGKARKAAADEGTGPVAVAAPLAAAIVAPPPAAQDQAAQSDAASAGDPIAAGPSAAAKQAEILAADPQGTASAAAPAKDDKDFASLLAAAPQAAAAEQNAKAHAPAAAHAEAAAVRVDTPVGARGWSNEVGEKLTWMVNKHETRADLVLNPPELGRIEVSISVKGDQASASFVSANPAVRDAIENAVPRLREVLQDAGISLGQTQVGAESFQQQQSAANRENGDNSWRGGNVGATDSEAAPGGILNGGASAAIRRGNGLVDTFA